jgi:hypothetical protein
MRRIATERLELRVTPAFLQRIEAWRAAQPGPPNKTTAIVHLINLGLEAAELSRKGLALFGRPHPPVRRTRGQPDET